MQWSWRHSSLGPELRRFQSEQIPGHAQLLAQLGWEDPEQWYEAWQRRGGTGLGATVWPFAVRPNWLWGVGFPLLTALEQRAASGVRSIVGLSGLPGCGKSSLSAWIQQVSRDLGLAVAVVSLDDFYWPAEEMERAMEGNPWRVPRALPGSHDLGLMRQCLHQWRAGGAWRAPSFDKSLREGKGDRSGWNSTSADVLLLEGWFVGVSNGTADTQLDPPLSAAEQQYRGLVQSALSDYQPVWCELDALWHLRAPRVSATRLWKTQQENSMLKAKGVKLPKSALAQFIRMIEAAHPQDSLQTITRADVVVELTEDRVVWELR